MTEILSRQQLVDAILPLLVDVGWQPLPVGAQTYVAVRGSWWLDFGHGSFNLDARDPEGYSAQIAGAEVGSVDQAVAYLRVAGVLPAAEVVGYVVVIPENGRWVADWDGELHAELAGAEASCREAREGNYPQDTTWPDAAVAEVRLLGGTS